MTDTKIPDAVDILDKKDLICVHAGVFTESGYSLHDCKDAMIEFAKLHVQAALKAASEKAEISGEWGDPWKDDRLRTRDADGNWIDVGADGNSILNAYPLENIK